MTASVAGCAFPKQGASSLQKSNPPASKEVERPFVLAAWKGDVAQLEKLLQDGVSVDTRFGGNSKAFMGADGGWPVAGEN